MQKFLTKREQLVFYLTLGVLFFSLIFNFLLAPLLTKNENLNKEIKVTRVKLKKYLKLLADKDYFESKTNNLPNTLGLSADSTRGVVTVLSEIEDRAKNSGIRIIDIRPQGQKGKEFYKESIIDVRTEGSLDNYLKFIYSLENSLSVLRIKKFQLNARQNSTDLEGLFSVSQLAGSE